MNRYQREFFIEMIVPALIAICIGMGILFLAGCDEREKLRAEIWSVDPDDGTLYRRLNNGTEEFLYCTSPSAAQFKCMHRNDIEQVIIKATRRCE